MPARGSNCKFYENKFLCDCMLYFRAWGMSMQDVRDASGLDQQTVSRLLNMHGGLSLYSAIALADAADLKLDDYRHPPEWWSKELEEAS
jgi:transcriptional regulator with XRE-family HTH domain